VTPTVRTFLDLSTGHLREETCRQLGDYEGVIAHEMEYGWLMYVPVPDDDAGDQSDWPEELLPIMRLAHTVGCAYILFDADAPHTENLPIFDW
jgi:hypothetical protein